LLFYLCQIRSHVRILIIIGYYTLLYSYNFNPIKNNMVVISSVIYCFLASELSIEKKKKKILDRQQIASQWRLQLIFRMHNSNPTPQHSSTFLHFYAYYAYMYVYFK
jgi:hypothetical protein